MALPVADPGQTAEHAVKSVFLMLRDQFSEAELEDLHLLCQTMIEIKRENPGSVEEMKTRAKSNFQRFGPLGLAYATIVKEMMSDVLCPSVEPIISVSFCIEEYLEARRFEQSLLQKEMEKLRTIAENKARALELKKRKQLEQEQLKWKKMKEEESLVQ